MGSPDEVQVHFPPHPFLLCPEWEVLLCEGTWGTQTSPGNKQAQMGLGAKSLRGAQAVTFTPGSPGIPRAPSAPARPCRRRGSVKASREQSRRSVPHLPPSPLPAPVTHPSPSLARRACEALRSSGALERESRGQG